MNNLTTCLREVVPEQEIDKQKITDLQNDLSEVKSDQGLCSMKLSESLQKLNSLNLKNTKQKIDRREQEISELTGVNEKGSGKVCERLTKSLKVLLRQLKNYTIVIRSFVG